MAVADDNQGAEAQVLAAFDHLGDAVDRHHRVLDVELRRIDALPCFHWSSQAEHARPRLELQSRFSGRVGDGANAAVIEKPAAVEHDACDALFDRTLRNRFANRFGALQVPAANALGERALQRWFRARRRHERLAGHIVDHLRVDMRHAAEYRQARPLFRAGHPLALAEMNSFAAIRFRGYLHIPVPAGRASSAPTWLLGSSLSGFLLQ